MPITVSMVEYPSVRVNGPVPHGPRSVNHTTADSRHHGARTQVGLAHDWFGDRLLETGRGLSGKPTSHFL